MMERNTSLILLVLLVLLNGCFLFEVDGSRTQGKYELIERRKSYEQTSSKPNLELPLRSAFDIGDVQYIVTMNVGTPPQEFFMSLSTCSVLSWIKCRNQCRNCSSEKESPDKRFYQPNKSRSFRTVPCSSSFCTSDLIPAKANEVCPTPDAPCRYDHYRRDGTKLFGTIGNDTVTIRTKSNQKVILENITIGCTEKIKSKIPQPLDGLLGLAAERQSFAAKALRQTRTTSFSYCLVDYLTPINVSGYLVFGGDNQLPNMQETDLLIGHYTWSTCYHLNVSGISVDGKMLDIPSDTWIYNPDGEYGGVMLEVGNPLTSFAAPVYDKLIQGLLPFISKFKKVKGKVLEHCFNSTGFNETLVPKLAIHFGNGAKFEPPVRNYVINQHQDVKCLAFSRFDKLEVSMIGNILQQNYLWEFDVLNDKLRFAPSTCTSD
ncbi:NANA [Hibiscus trionum]|uniref:NANA n=1 Tax=Hibiscus trionum TaxID=183268 RepID=A0A9W7LV16_HIBTR|nr:NANA [Hibiscus trionum]